MTAGAPKPVRPAGSLLRYLPGYVRDDEHRRGLTLLGGIVAIVLSLLSTRGIARWPRLMAVSRRMMDVMRALPEGVVALHPIFVLGGGPVPAVTAIAFHTGGAFGKLVPEALRVPLRPLLAGVVELVDGLQVPLHEPRQRMRIAKADHPGRLPLPCL
jgi:hypothetical protein